MPRKDRRVIRTEVNNDRDGGKMKYREKIREEEAMEGSGRMRNRQS